MTQEKLKTVYIYDEDGYFADTNLAQLNPRGGEGDYLYPENCTVTAPELKAGFFYKIRKTGDVNSGWKSEAVPTNAVGFLKVKIPHKSQTAHSHTMRTLLRQFVANEADLYREKQVTDAEGNVLYLTVEEIPQPTAEEKLAAKKAEVKAKRNAMLAETDYLLASDYPIEAAALERVKAYRTALRNITEQKGYPFDVKWPVMPKV